jgi:TnpA family transposase
LALKKSTVGTIVKKISNLPEGNSLRRAFAELNRLLASIYILKYINSMTLRRDVQKSINRNESYHKLKRTVAYANSGKIFAKSESEQNVYQNSSMVICSAIIYYNSLILSFLLNQKRYDIEQVKRTTPIAWDNINLYGKYIFSKRKKSINLEKQIPKFFHNNK